MQVDVAIIGGGVAGAAAAVALCRAGTRVAVLERGLYAQRSVGEHLPPAARPLLARLGLLGQVMRGGPDLSERSYLFGAYGEGWNLDRQRLGRDLADAAQEAGAILVLGARLGALERDAAGWRIEVATPDAHHRLRSRFVVDASGRSAAVARRLGARRVAADDLVALVGLCRAGDSIGEDAALLVEALPEGWWYEVPVPGGLAIAAWLTDRRAMQDGSRGAVALWRRQFGQARHLRLPRAVEPLELRIGSAHTAWTEPAAGEGWLAIGDAALAPDPLSSSGLLSALETALAAATALAAGTGPAFRSYAGWLEARRRRFLLERAQTYALEHRWPDHRFWQHRHR
jgi:flavin-dependent dehydrogenase